MRSSVIDKTRLIRDLRHLGLKAGDLVMVHSSLSAIGRVKGGANTLVQALLDVLTPSGTLAMPVFGTIPFDVKTSASTLGVIPEALRTHPRAVRSFHPTHSVAAVGPRADDLIAKHLESPTAAGRDTPYGRLIDMGGKILLLGVDNDRNTTMHTLEEYVGAPYLSDRKVTYLDSRGREHTKTLKLFPGPHRDFIGLDPLFREQGVEIIGKVGDAVARLIDAKKMHDAVLAAFKDDAALVLCDNPNCDDCVMQRSGIRLARLRQEAFTLSALASSISAYPDEIACEMKRAGVHDLVIDKLYGRPVWSVTDARLKRAVRTCREEGITISAVFCSADPEDADSSLRVVEMLGAETAVVPFPPSLAAFLTAARRRGIRMLFENTAFPSRLCLKLLREAKASEALAFNPANAAIAGEHPFLGTYRGPLKREVGMLLLADATFGGQYTLPSRGNGEVKELLSSLRARSFRGRVVIATGAGGPPFRELVEGFWAMMDAS